MSDRNDAVRGMLTYDWQNMNDIAKQCCEEGLYTNIHYAQSSVYKLFTAMEKYGFAEHMNVECK